MKTSFSSLRRGFTLIELIVAMAITSILVVIIVGLTNAGLDIWKSISEDISTSTRARVALQNVCQDLDSMQWQRGNKFQWLFADSEKTPRKQADAETLGPKGLRFANASRLIFFTSSIDRSPAVSSDENLRSNYRAALAHNLDTQGDVNAVGYKLFYRDQILNLQGGKDGRAFPLYSLYRQRISPRDTFDYLLGREDLEKAYTRFARDDEKNFLVENIIEMTVTFEVEYKGSNPQEKTRSKFVSIPVIAAGSGRNTSNELSLYGDRLVVRGASVGDVANGRLVAANISITVVTEDGINYANLIRLGKRRAPRKLEDFFSKYTRTFARRVLLPQAN